MKKAIVIDNGTSYSKNGFAGEDQPRSVFSTLIGYPEPQMLANFNDQVRKYYIGTEALRISKLLRLVYPIDHCIVDNWDSMEDIWQYTFQEELRVNPSEHPVLLMESPLIGPRLNREKMAEIMFETFKVPALFVSNQAFLALYASGRTTGVVVDIGESLTQIVPIYEGFVISHAVQRLDIGGRDITEFLGRLLFQRGYKFSGLIEHDWIRKIKESCCYVSLDPEKEIKRGIGGKEKIYLLPYGETLTIGFEAFVAPEMLFNPATIGLEAGPIDENIYFTIQNTDISLRDEFYANIVLAGGSTLFPGFKERLHKQLTEMVPEAIEVRLIAPPERKYSAWYGGSICSSLKSFQRLWITEKDYFEVGPTVIHRCFNMRFDN
ncbi:MAG: actin, cytoplasmic 2, partial [Candidatus Hodarchaeota archaeon]